MFSRRQLLASLPALAVAGCAQEEEVKAPALPKVKWQVVCSTSQLGEIARHVGGDAVEVIELMPRGMSPYQFEFTAATSAKVRLCDVVLLHGLALESKWSIDWASVERSGVIVARVAESIPPDRLLFPNGPENAPDPHVWMDPRLCALMATTVADVFTKAIPRLADFFADRAHTYRFDLNKAHDWIRGIMAQVKPEARFLFSSHDSLRYFASAYELESLALASAAAMAPVALPETTRTWLATHRVGMIFREQDSSEEQIRGMLGDVKIDSSNVLYSLALAPADTEGLVGANTYDVATLIGALSYTGDLVQTRLFS
jgi:ABC-type Zn uptake system ZnuABC Zn-binding protein ZnuA